MEQDAISQKTKVATAAEELFERFPRRRYKTRKEKKEHQSFLTEQAIVKTTRETKEKDEFVRECAARNEYLEG